MHINLHINDTLEMAQYICMVEVHIVYKDTQSDMRTHDYYIHIHVLYMHLHKMERSQSKLLIYSLNLAEHMSCLRVLSDGVQDHIRMLRQFQME